MQEKSSNKSKSLKNGGGLEGRSEKPAWKFGKGGVLI